MIKKAIDYLDGCRPLGTYADNEVEAIAIGFFALIIAILWLLKELLLIVTCPIWVIPYCIFKKGSE